MYTGQDYIEKYGEYNVLRITEKGLAILKGEQTPQLLKPVVQKAKVKLAKAASDSWKGVDKGLFEALRELRAKISAKKKIPAYIVFGDASLRDMARRRPSTLEGFGEVKGVGKAKCKQYGKAALTAIKDYCQTNSVQMDITAISFDSSICEPQRQSRPNGTKLLAFDMFKRKLSIEKVAKSIGRAESTTTQYLAEYIEQENISSPQPWIDKQTFDNICNAVKGVGGDKLKPIYDFLNSEIDYNQIRIGIACLRNK